MLEAFTLKVEHTDKLNFNNFSSFDKNELYIGVSGRLNNVSSCVYLDSKILAEQYNRAITARRINSGDKAFEATIETIRSYHPEFENEIKMHSEKIRKKLEKWCFPKPKVNYDETGWLVFVQHSEREEKCYLKSLGKTGKLIICTDKSTAKIYKRRSFVLKAIEEINKIPKCKALAIEVS